MKNWIRKIAAIIIITGFSGCAMPQKIGPGETVGEIYVGRPQLYPRERLVQENKTEYDFYTDLLTNPDFRVVRRQALDERQVSQMLASELAASFDPLGGKLADQGVKNQTKNLERQQEADVYEYEIKLQKLKNELAELQKDPTQVSTPTDSTTTVTVDNKSSEARILSLQGDITKLQAALDATRSKPSTKTFDDSKSQPRNSAANTTAIEDIEDITAARDYMRATRREFLLDDAHDLKGKTQYTLKFNFDIVPPKDVEQLLVLQFKIKDKKASADTYKYWVKGIEEYIYADAYEKVNRFKAKIPQQDLSLALAGNLNPKQSPSAPSALGKTTEPKANTLKADLNKVSGNKSENLPVGGVKLLTKPAVLNGANIPQDTLGSSEDFNTTLFNWVSEKYGRLGGAKLLTPDSMSQLGFSLDPVKVSAGVFALKTEIDKQGSYVMSVSPKYYGQNISVVDARENILSLAMAFQALLPNGIGIKEATSYQNKRQRFIDALTRNPLAMGFAQGDKTFGWIVGPRFKVSDDGKVGYEHQPQAYSFDASFAVPGWFNDLDFELDAYWIDARSGNRIKDATTYINGDLEDNVGNKRKLSIDLPGNTGSLVESILALSGEDVGPEILVSASGSQKIAKLPNQTFIIRGSHMWRNPSVTIGTYKVPEASIEILRDMGGLMITLQDPLPFKANEKLDLTVTTTNGYSRAEGYVLLGGGGEDAAKGLQFASIVPVAGLVWDYSGTATTKPQLSADINLENAPPGQPMLRGVIKGDRATSSYEEGVSNNALSDFVMNRKSRKMYFKLPIKLTGSFVSSKNAERFSVDILMPKETGDAGESILSRPASFVAFKDIPSSSLVPDSSQLTWTNGLEAASVKFGMVSSVEPDLFLEGYPGFEASVKAGKAFLKFEEKSFVLKMGIDDSGKEFLVAEIDNASRKALQPKEGAVDKKYTAKVSYNAGQEVEIPAGEIAFKAK